MNGRHSTRLSRRERRLFLRAFLLAMAVAIGLLLFMPGHGWLGYHRAQQDLARLQEENQALQKENQRLAAELERLRHDDRYLEEVVRKRYGYLKDGELIFDFTPKKQKRSRKD